MARGCCRAYFLFVALFERWQSHLVLSLGKVYHAAAPPPFYPTLFQIVSRGSTRQLAGTSWFFALVELVGSITQSPSYFRHGTAHNLLEDLYNTVFICTIHCVSGQRLWELRRHPMVSFDALPFDVALQCLADRALSGVRVPSAVREGDHRTLHAIFKHIYSFTSPNRLPTMRCSFVPHRGKLAVRSGYYVLEAFGDDLD